MGYLHKIARLVERKSWDRIFLRSRELELLGQDVRNPYLESDIYHSCIKVTARALSQLPWRIVKMEGSGEDAQENPIEDENHPARILFRQPNEIMSRYDLWEALFTYYLDQGEAFILPWPPLSMTKRNWPEELFVVNPSFMEHVIEDSTKRLIGWIYKPRSDAKIQLAASDVLCWRNFNPYDPYRGLRPIDIIRIAVDSDYKAAKYNEKFFEHGGIVSGVIETERKFTKDQENRWMGQLEQRHMGYLRSHKWLILDKGAKYKEAGLNQRDMEWIAGRRISAERIMQMFGMKKAVLSVTDDLNFAIAKEQKKSWWVDTLLPLARMVQDQFALKFWAQMPEPGLKGYFDTSVVDELQEDYNQKVATAFQLWQMGFTANEINDRMALGFEDTELREVCWVPSGYEPIARALEPPQPAPHEMLEEPEEEYEEEEYEEEPFEEEEEEEEEEKTRRKLLTYEGSTRKWLWWNNSLKERIWLKFAVETEPIEKKFEKKTQRLFFEMRQKALAALKEPKKHAKGIDELGDLDWEEERKNVSGYAAPIYEEALTTGFSFMGELIGVNDLSWQVTYPEAAQFVAGKKLKIKGIVDTVESQIKDVVKQSIDEGWSIDKTADELKTMFNFASKRARTIARTEVIGAVNAGEHYAMREAGIEWRMWLTARDEKVRHTHVAADGDVRRIDEDFVVGGANLKFPGDPNGPAKEIINCRCIPLPLDEPPETQEVVAYSRPQTIEEAERIGQAFAGSAVYYTPDAADLTVKEASAINDTVSRMQKKYHTGKLEGIFYNNAYKDNGSYKFTVSDAGRGVITVGRSSTYTKQQARAMVRQCEEFAAKYKEIGESALEARYFRMASDWKKGTAPLKPKSTEELKRIWHSASLWDKSSATEQMIATTAHEMGHSVHHNYGTFINRSLGVTIDEKKSLWSKYITTGRSRDSWYECVAESVTLHSKGYGQLLHPEMRKVLDRIATGKVPIDYTTTPGIAYARVPQPPPSWIKKVAKEQAERMKAYADKYGMTIEDYKKACTKHMEDIVTASSIWMRRRSATLMQIIKDGRFKTQFETGRSGGLLANDLRLQFEAKVLGVAKNAPVETRPLYGYLSDHENGMLGKASGVSQYGDCAIKFKSGIVKRTTFVTGDSMCHTDLGDVANFQPMPVSKPSYKAGFYWDDPYSKDPYLPMMEPLSSKTSGPIPRFYWETQTHGGLTIDDIEEVVFKKAPEKELQKLLDKYGISWRVVKK